MAFSATANAELKVATVDVQKLFADYYKTHEAQAEVDKAAQAVQQDNNTRAESIKKMEADFTEMVKKLQDPSLNEKDKKDLEQKAQITRQQAIALEQERRTYVERQLKSLQEQMKLRSTNIMGEITKVAEGIATKSKLRPCSGQERPGSPFQQRLRLHQAQHGHHPHRDEGTQQGRARGL